MSSDERQRLAALHSYRVLDTSKEQSFDRIVELAAALFEAPMAAVSLIDTDRQWFKAEVGLGIRETPRKWAFCDHTIREPGGLLVVEDAQQDARFQANPLVQGDPHIRFYAGVALTNSAGQNLGSLCVIDTQPLQPKKIMLDQLELLAKLAVGELELGKARANLSEKQQLLTLAERMSGVGHWRYDLLTGKIEWSAEVYRIHGVTPETFDPQLDDAISFFHPDDRDHIKLSVANAIATGNGYEFSRRLIGRDGVTHNVTCKAVCETNEAGKVVAIFGLFQDVTNHIRALNAAKEAVAVKTEFLANMSHELRTPLTSVIGFSELLRQQPDLSERSKGYADRVASGSQALLATVNDVLDFSKLEAGQVELRPKPSSPAQVFGEAIELFQSQADAKGIAVLLEMAPSVPAALLFDPDRVRQVLLNLIGNAVKFTAKGAVSVKTEYRAPGLLTFEVSDTGPGMNEAQLSRLFQRFSQVDESLSRSHGGTGLGLAICKGLVDAMGGEISVTSTPGAGSTFRVAFACSRAALVPSAGTHSTDPLSLDAYRILVADDNASNRALVAASLKPTGVELTLAEGGRQAVERAAQTPFDLILLDLHMPDIDGQAALEMIRRGRGPNFGVPIMAFTAEAGSGLQHLAKIGFDGVVPKPILPNEFVRQISSKLTENVVAEETGNKQHA